LPWNKKENTLADMVKITGDYQGGLHCTAVHGPSGTKLTTDAPKDNQGRGEAFSPTDLVATAYATCIATTMAIVARKYGVDLTGLRYEVTKEMTATPPRRIAKLTAHIWLPPDAAKLPDGLLDDAAHGCPVHRSLAPEVERIIEFHRQA
jgi:uncharacterized OsmC-like protein